MCKCLSADSAFFLLREGIAGFVYILGSEEVAVSSFHCWVNDAPPNVIADRTCRHAEARCHDARRQQLALDRPAHGLDAMAQLSHALVG